LSDSPTPAIPLHSEPDSDLNRAGRRHGIALPDRIAVSPREAARMLGLSHVSLYALLNAGEIRSVKAGGRRLIAVSELRRFVGDPGTE
jgi:excisionase family DNA binding protein